MACLFVCCFCQHSILLTSDRESTTPHEQSSEHLTQKGEFVSLLFHFLLTLPRSARASQEFLGRENIQKPILNLKPILCLVTPYLVVVPLSSYLSHYRIDSTPLPWHPRHRKGVNLSRWWCASVLCHPRRSRMVTGRKYQRQLATSRQATRQDGWKTEPA